MTLEEILRIIKKFFQDVVLCFNVKDVPSFVFDWMRAHPGQTVFYVVNGVLVFTPAFLTGPILASMGWGASGPAAGECSAVMVCRRMEI